MSLIEDVGLRVNITELAALVRTPEWSGLAAERLFLSTHPSREAYAEFGTGLLDARLTSLENEDERVEVRETVNRAQQILLQADRWVTLWTDEPDVVRVVVAFHRGESVTLQLDEGGWFTMWLRNPVLLAHDLVAESTTGGVESTVLGGDGDAIAWSSDGVSRRSASEWSGFGPADRPALVAAIVEGTAAK